MREHHVGKKPEYKKVQTITAEQRVIAKRYEVIIEYIVSIRQIVNRIVDEQIANRHQHNLHEAGKRKRDNRTIIALAITAIVGAGGIIISHRDTTKALREAHATADQQHADTLVAINRTNDTIAAMQTQAGIMRGQLDEMHNERRAWVTVDIKIVDAVDYTVNGTHIGLLFTLRNIGKTPAVAVFPHLRANPFMGGMAQAQQEQCAKRTFGSLTVFPGDQRVIPINTDIPKEETDKLWDKYPEFRPMIFPVLLVCIVYRMPGEGTEHHTPLNFKLVRRHSDIGDRAPSAIFVDEGRVPVENLQLFDQSILFGSGPD